MPLASVSTSYASLSSRAPSSARPPSRSWTPIPSPAGNPPSADAAGAAAGGRKSSTETQARRPASEATPRAAAPPSRLRSSQLMTYLAKRSQPTPVNPSCETTRKRTSASALAPPPQAKAHASSNKAAVLDQKLKCIQALSAPVKRPRATLDAPTPSRAAPNPSLSGGSFRPHKSRKLNPTSVHEQGALKTTGSQKAGVASRPSSSKRIDLSANASIAPSRRGHAGPLRLPPAQLADTAPAGQTTVNPPPHPAPASSTDTRTSPPSESTAPPQHAPLPSTTDSLLVERQHQELENLRVKLAAEHALRTATARDLLLLQAGVELMHAESTAKVTSLSTELAHAQETIVTLEAQLKDMHTALTTSNKQWQEILFEELDKLETQAHEGVKVAMARAGAAKREAGLWKRRAEAAEGMVKWYEKVIGNVSEDKEKDGAELKVKTDRSKRRETWAPTATTSGQLKAEWKESAVVQKEEDKENASHAQVEVVKNGGVEGDKKKKSRRTVA